MNASESEAGKSVGLTVQQWILDTNIWLDWFVFAQADDAPVVQLKRLIEQGLDSQQRIVMTQAMWDEWVDVLARPQFAIEPERQAQILAQTRALVTLRADVPPPFERIRCTDRDDQVFIDAALVHRVDWLISKDRHLLRLRNRARQWGVRVVSPQDWLQSVTAGAAAPRASRSAA